VSTLITGCDVLLSLRGDVSELGVPVRVLAPFDSLGVASGMNERQTPGGTLRAGTRHH
jgi:hypothetical protein